MPSYGLTSYWEERYASTEAAVVEWHLTPDILLKLVPELATPPRKNMSILLVGCGSSQLPVSLASAGWGRVHCVDASSALMSCLSTRYQHRSSITLSTEDATQLSSCEAGSFAVAIDKGLTDALLCSAQGVNAVRKMLAGVHLALQGGGCLLMVTKAPPSQIDDVLEPRDPPVAAAAAAAKDGTAPPHTVSLDTPAAVTDVPVSAGSWGVSSVLIGGQQGERTALYLHTLQCRR